MNQLISVWMICSQVRMIWFGFNLMGSIIQLTTNWRKIISKNILKYLLKNVSLLKHFYWAFVSFLMFESFSPHFIKSGWDILQKFTTKELTVCLSFSFLAGICPHLKKIINKKNKENNFFLLHHSLTSEKISI